jgi:4-amino-4-deoxy-L-arabinose transferase-like glycosyltransferase
VFVNTPFRLDVMPKLNVDLTLKGLSIAFFLEALVMYLATSVIIWAMITGAATALASDAVLALLTASAALWLTLAARAIRKKKRWARSAGVFWQLIQLTIAFGTFEASLIGGLAIAIPSVLVFLVLFNKQIVEATMEQRD